MARAFVSTVILTITSYPVVTKWDDYTPGADGVKWLKNCDYAGFDIDHKFMPEEKCSRACIDTRGCNAFSWHDGWCFLKRKPASLTRSPLFRGGRCGLLPWEFEGKPDIYIDNSATVVSNHTQIFPQQPQQMTSKSQQHWNRDPSLIAFFPQKSGGKNRERIDEVEVEMDGYDDDGDEDRGSSGYYE